MIASESEGSTPLLYKFYSPQTLIALQEGTLGFTPPNRFNDAFEFLPRIVRDEKSIELRQEKGIITRDKLEQLWQAYNSEHGTSYTREQFSSLIEDHKEEIAAQVPIALEVFSARMAKEMVDLVSREFGVACFSKSWSHPLMWGHYSRGYTGFAVGYEMPHDGEIQALSRVDVEYSPERFPLSEAIVLAGQVPVEIVNGIVRTKSAHWAYEQEVRFLIATDNPVLTPKPDRSQFYLKHPPEAVREIIIGMRHTDDTKLALLKLRNESYPHAALYETAPDDSTFEIERKVVV
jgi:hypothetical protein